MKALAKGALTKVFETAKRIVSKGFDIVKAGLGKLHDHFYISPEDRDLLAADGTCPMGGDVCRHEQERAQARVNKRLGIHK